MIRTAWTSPTLICIGLLGLTLATYWPSLSCSFVNLDDIDYVYRNHDVLAGFSWSGWNYVWTSFVCNNWHPLTILSLGIDDHLWGLNPVGYHATNLAFHCANVLLLFLVLNRMTRCLIPSLIVAALFAVHPLHVESVAWVSERKDVLSTFFLLLTIGAYLEYASQPSFWRYCLVFTLMAMGLMAKPMLVTLPILLLLLDAWPLDRIQGSMIAGNDDRFRRQTFRWLLLEKIPLFVLSLADSLITIIAQGTAKDAMPKLGIATRIGHLFYSYDWYMWKTLFPVNLIAYYPHPQQALSWFFVGIGVLSVAMISWLAVWRIKSRPYLAFGWAWFIVTLLPVIGIIQVGTQAYADRYAYIPHIGLFIAIVWGLYELAQKTKIYQTSGTVMTIIAIGGYALLAHQQVYYWKSSETLWTHALQVLPDNGVAHLSLGDYLVANRKYEQAIPHFEKGVQLTDHGIANAYCNWAKCLTALNRPVEAEQKLREAIKNSRYHETALGELSKLLVKQRRYDEAAQISAQYDKAFAQRSEKNPQDYRVEVELGLYEIRRRNLKEAIQHFQKAAELAPYSAAALNNLANAQMELRQLGEAKRNYLKALELNPQLNGAHYNLAVILENEHDREGAKLHYAEAYRINPQDLEAKRHVDRLSKP